MHLLDGKLTPAWTCNSVIGTVYTLPSKSKVTWKQPTATWAKAIRRAWTNSLVLKPAPVFSNHREGEGKLNWEENPRGLRIEDHQRIPTQGSSEAQNKTKQSKHKPLLARQQHKEGNWGSALVLSRAVCWCSCLWGETVHTHMQSLILSITSSERKGQSFTSCL